MKYRGLLARLDTDTTVPDLQEQRIGASPATDQQTAMIGIANSITDQVAQDQLDQGGVGMSRQGGVTTAVNQLLSVCLRPHLLLQLAE